MKVYSKKLATHNDVTVTAYVFVPGNSTTVTREGSQATDGWEMLKVQPTAGATHHPPPQLTIYIQNV